MESHWTQTNNAIGVGLIVLLVLHLIALLLFREKRFKWSSGFYSGLLISFLGSIPFMIHWFISLESTGPVGAGIGIFISPIVGAMAIAVLFSVGWSLHQIIQFYLSTLFRKDSPFSRKRLVTSIILLLVSVFVIQAYIRSYMPHDYDLQAVPEENFTNSIGMDMIKVSKGYWVGKYEVTQSQFEEIMGFNPLTKSKESLRRYGAPNKPVMVVTSNESLDFCQKLTDIEKAKNTLPEGYIYTLPTFKQWLEYVADAKIEGSITPIGYKGGQLSGPLPVGSGEVNRLGIYELRGNVCEYCSKKSPYGNPIIVGASWLTHGKEFLLIKNKASFSRSRDKSTHVGFRIILAKAVNSKNRPTKVLPLKK